MFCPVTQNNGKVLFFFITKVKLDTYKEIILTEEKSPSEQTSENSSVQTPHMHQEGELMVLVFSSVSVLLSDVCSRSVLSSI